MSEGEIDGLVRELRFRTDDGSAKRRAANCILAMRSNISRLYRERDEAREYGVACFVYEFSNFSTPPWFDEENSDE